CGTAGGRWRRRGRRGGRCWVCCGRRGRRGLRKRQGQRERRRGGGWGCWRRRTGRRGWGGGVRGRDALWEWCRGGSGPVRVVGGPTGVGKTKLALEVAGRLPAEWVAGRLIAERRAELVERVTAAGDPALVVVDDADLLAGVDQVLDQVARQ